MGNQLVKIDGLRKSDRRSGWAPALERAEGSGEKVEALLEEGWVIEKKDNRVGWSKN